MNNDDRKRIAYERQKAVKAAWKEEAQRVRENQGTRNWDEAEKKELLERGSVSGYAGHHMKSVSLYPEYAGDPKNIQFLTESEHLYGAHQGSFHNKTNGYFNPLTQKMEPFADNQKPSVPIIKLNNNSGVSKKDTHKKFDSNSFKSSLNIKESKDKGESIIRTQSKSKGINR